MDTKITKKYPKIAQLGNVTTTYKGKTKTEDPHLGIDIAFKNGTPIKSNTKGTVINITNEPYDFGRSIQIKDNKGNIHRYSHLRDMFVKKGMNVEKDTHIANGGNTGNSYSPSGGDSSHLDYRVTGKGGKSINPTKFFK